MILSVEIATNPGPSALFVAEVRLESNGCTQPREPWWALWLGWWLFPLREWKTWLWASEYLNIDRWHTLMVRLLGFELNLQYWRKHRHG